jgi:hypothetical protein
MYSYLKIQIPNLSYLECTITYKNSAIVQEIHFADIKKWPCPVDWKGMGISGTVYMNGVLYCIYMFKILVFFIILSFLKVVILVLYKKRP